MASFTFDFPFISTIVFETYCFIQEDGKEKDLNACCQMANIQPTRSRGEGTEEVKTIMSYRSLLDQTLLFFKAKVWSAGGGRTCRAGTELSASPCPPACAHSHSGAMLIDKVSLGILAPVAHIMGRGFCGDARVAVSVLLLPDVYGTRPSQVHAAVVAWSSWQPSGSDAAHRGLPGATGRGIVSPELSCLPQLVKCRIPWNLLLVCCPLGAFLCCAVPLFFWILYSLSLACVVVERAFACVWKCGYVLDEQVVKIDFAKKGGKIKIKLASPGFEPETFSVLD